MKLSQEEFELKFQESIDSLVEEMVEHEQIEPRKFFGMVYFLENLAFFSPVIWGLIEKKNQDDLT